MDLTAERAAQFGIETEYWDALGTHREADPRSLALLIEALSASDQSKPRASAMQSEPVGPVHAFQGSERTPQKLWVLSVQLYGVRSHRNWGHGDFTDLAGLIELAADLGAAGIGLNPIHALFDEWAEASPYSPNSRLFLNPRYIDVEAVPEFPGVRAADMEKRIEALRAQELVDYPGVIAAKTHALRLAFDEFRRRPDAERQLQFEDYRRERGLGITRFACFEHLRRKFNRPWREWPNEWRRPRDGDIDRLRDKEEDVAFYEFMQWIAHEQLTKCLERVRARNLALGLYLDIAVGVRADGFDAWNDQETMLAGVEVGAPPDLLNTGGQKWGVVSFNPLALARSGCDPFRRMLGASMRYAGAIRLDHVMGLQRLFLIPDGIKGENGLYVRYPLQAMLAATAEESLANACIVIGEDLGTVPENFRETVAEWGIWAYQVMLFERSSDGTYRPPEHYRENALATLATHDMPTFRGWLAARDLAVKRALGIDPGETDTARNGASQALATAVSERGLPSLDLLAALRFLAAARSRLVAVSLEDVLGEIEQVNLPGTIDEHPNWRRRTAVALEDLRRDSHLAAVAQVMAEAARGITPKS